MSYTELYAVQADGDVRFYGEVKNSFQGAFHVWNTLNNKYGFGDTFLDQYKKTWGNFDKNFYEEYEDIVLGSTFDNVLILKKDFDKLISAFDKYSDSHIGSNYKKQIKIIEEMKKEDVLAVGWCQTSVSNDTWDYAYHEETGEVIPYNVNKGEKHWYLDLGEVAK